MKRLIYSLLILSLLAFSCNKQHKQHKSATNAVSSKIIDSLEQVYIPGAYVLAPSQLFLSQPSYDSMKVLVFYPRRLKKFQGLNCIVSFYDSSYAVPAKFVIPFPLKQKARKGDLVLTWWQSGIGMQRAYVVNDSNPFQPIVRYLDLDMYSNGKGKESIEKLKPGTFRLIDRPLQPGTAIAVHKRGAVYEYNVVVNVIGDTVVAVNWSKILHVYPRRKVIPNPPRHTFKSGDIVWVPVYGLYTYGTLLSVKDGCAEVQVKVLGQNEIKCVPVVDIFKHLP